MKALVALGACALAGVLAGCGQTQDGSNPAGDPVTPSLGTSQPVSGDETDATPADIAAAGLTPCPASDPDVPAVADGLPDLTLKCLGAGPHVRLAGLRGKPTVVNVWASWCGPCRVELPIMGEVSRAMPAVRFLGIDMADSRQAALAMAGQANMSFPSVMDPDSAVRAGLRVYGVPATFFVRPDGTIAGRAAVISTQAQLRALIATYLGVTS